MKKDELIVKICKKVIVVFGILTVFNFIMLISGKSYALFTRTITTNDPVIHIETATELPTPTLVKEVKSKLVKYEDANKSDFRGGLVAVNTNGELYNEADSTQEIREYRYSGLNVDNYVIFNNEEWRIIGVFKEGEEEFVKIVRNENLLEGLLPDTYKIGEITYKINAEGDENTAYWNNKVEEKGNSDWTTAGIQYYLNTEQDDSKVNKGYLSYLSNDAKNMIRDSKYYLGNYYFYQEYMGGGAYSNFNSDTSIEAYNHERGNELCDSSVEYNSYNNNCSIWYGNQASWNGEVGLLYPSDIGYSTLSIGWKNKIAGCINYVDFGACEWDDNKLKLSWITNILEEKMMSNGIFTITPGSYSKNLINIYSKYKGYYDETSDYRIVSAIDYQGNDSSSEPSAILPTLYLKTNVEILEGNGNKLNPYKITI